MKRSDFLQNSALLLGGSLLPGSVLADDQEKRTKIRFAFMTDIHAKPGPVSETGMAKALHHIQQLRPKVDFIINGGDSINDALGADKASTKAQWDVFQSILRNENSLQVRHCIGNHDVWGWFLKTDKPVGDALYGKQWAIESLGIQRRFYSFTQGKWHFIVLDSTQLNPEGGYIAYLDTEQLDWVKKELADHANEKFICFVSHIPILSICAGLFFDKTEANGDLKIQRNLMHTDFLSLSKLFQQYPNIKACLSGHIHMQDEINYRGITYYCNGAISGNWWNGAFRGFDPAYAIFEFSDDGTSKRTMTGY